MYVISVKPTVKNGYLIKLLNEFIVVFPTTFDSVDDTLHEKQLLLPL